jgi:threonine aldolase
VDTNIIFFNVVMYDKLWFKNNIASSIVSILKEKGILVSAWSNILIRIVVHRNINETDVDYVIKELNELSCKLKDEIV